MKKKTAIILGLVAVVFIIASWFISTRNSFVTVEENTNGAWADVQTAYQRRADLIPQLIETVKGASNYEQGTFIAVTEARSKALEMNLNGEDITPENVAKFQQLQDNLKNELNKAINVTVERYPELTATGAYKDLMVQLEGTENRISVERKKFNDSVMAYNKKVRMFPASIVANMCGFEKKGFFEAAAGAEVAPKVSFE